MPLKVGNRFPTTTAALKETARKSHKKLLNLKSMKSYKKYAYKCKKINPNKNCNKFVNFKLIFSKKFHYNCSWKFGTVTVLLSFSFRTNYKHLNIYISSINIVQ